MIPVTPFVLGILGIIDAFSTYYSLKYQRMIFPKIAQHKGEKGLTTHFFINKYGVKKGLICNYILVILLAIGIYLFVLSAPYLDFFFIGLFIGMYLIVLMYRNFPTIEYYRYLLKTLQDKDKKKDVERFIELIEQEVELKEKIYMGK